MTWLILADIGCKYFRLNFVYTFPHNFHVLVEWSATPYTVGCVKKTPFICTSCALTNTETYYYQFNIGGFRNHSLTFQRRNQQHWWQIPPAKHILMCTLLILHDNPNCWKTSKHSCFEAISLFSRIFFCRMVSVKFFNKKFRFSTEDLINWSSL